MPGIPGAVCLNAALIRLPARKGKKEEKNMCNLSQKEGSSLFAVLPERGRHCQRTFLFTQRRFFFLGGGWICHLESNHIGLTRSLLTGKKHTALQVEVATWLQEPPSLSTWETLHQALNATWETLHQWSMLYVTVTQRSLEVLLTGCCLACFSFIQGQDEFYIPICLKVKCHFTVLTGLNATRLVEERQTLNKGRRMLGVWNEFLTLLPLSGLEKGIFCYSSVWTRDLR